MAVGEAFLSAFLQVLFDRLASRDFIRLLYGGQYDDLLEKLKLTLLCVTALLSDAEEKQFYSTAFQKWLHMAKDALYDAEDVLDDLATEALKSELESQSQNAPNLARNWHRISSSLSPSSRGIESSIRKIIEKLEFVAKYKDVLVLHDSLGGRQSTGKKRYPTTSLVDASSVYGRDNDRNNLIELLLSDRPGNGVSVVPIIGMAGVGKTTLAQLVYNDDRVRDHFDLRVWVFVSDQFNIARVTTEILMSVASKAADTDNLDLLQVKLKENLEGKKFLVVLDDVWNKRNNEWDVLWNPLRAGAKGSRVMVTTRDRSVATSMATIPAYHLRGLSFDDSWLLFQSQAFEGRSIDDHPNLEAIGREIVNKCEGLPLAVKTLGILLCSSKDEDEWTDILSRKIWDLPDGESDIFHSLVLSYHHLPAHLRPCFAYCAVFPNGYEVEKESLVLLWMAEGFVQQPKGKKRIEEVAEGYFNELVSRSFFEQSISSSSRFVVHGLMKEVAHFVSGEFCFRLEDKANDYYHSIIFEKARHSSYIRTIRDMFSKFDAFKGVECLRTFLPLDTSSAFGVSYLDNKVLGDLLPNLRFLRSLSLKAYRITDLPDSIGNLKHLRYLDLSCTAIKKLPDSICSLYNLQTLILLQCRSLTQLPREFSNLINLRHLQISESRLKEMPLQMSRLKNLQTLSHFVVGKDRGSGIRELKYMVQLHGALIISGLQNVVSYTDAVEANLKDKKELDQLVLQWGNTMFDTRNDADEEKFSNVNQLQGELKDIGIRGKRMARFPSFTEFVNEPIDTQNCSLDDSRDERLETDVLGLLQPHKNIRELIIKDYCGIKFPGWTSCPSFTKLTHLELSNCRKCKYLPPLGQLPSLKDLTVEGMEQIERVGTEFYHDGCSWVTPFRMLDSLRFENMPEWEEWSSSGIDGTEDFRKLKRIEIVNCPKIRNITHLFPSLEKMNIKGCNELTAFPRLQRFDSLGEGREFPCLIELSIRTCPKLFELPSSFPSLQIFEIDESPELLALPKLPSVCELELRKCDQRVLQSVVRLTSPAYLRMCHISDVRCLDEEFFQCFKALEELQISHFGELSSLSNEIGFENLSCLQRLEISGCPYLKVLPQNLCKLTSLQELRVCNCPLLLSFPETGFPPSLICLEIRDCEAFQSLPEWLMDSDEVPFFLEHLVIENCSSLTSLPNVRMPSFLKKLEISNCRNLVHFPDEMIQTNRSLEFLKIVGCHALTSLTEGTFESPAYSSSTAMKLKQLVINNCENLVSLPEGLHNLIFLEHLEISDCPLVLSFPHPGLPPSVLRSIKISNCRNLVSLPDRMYGLTSLQELCIDGCSSLMSFPEDGLPSNLVSLTILDCENLKPCYEWGLHRLTNLTDFSFGGCQELVLFPDNCLLPRNISYLRLEHLPNLQSLPNGVKTNASLETLHILECSNLRMSPEEEPLGMCVNLGFLDVL